MRKTRGFTLIELLVVISIIALLIGILLPALGAARRAARQMQNSGQIRGVHTGMTIYAQGNDGFFPGRTAGTESATRQRETVGAVQTGMHVQSRFRELLEDRYFTGEYINAPTDRRVPWTAGDVRMQHYSYSMLAMNGNLTTSTGVSTSVANLASQNASEWAETTNSEAVVISDRGIANGVGGLKSVHTQPDTTVADWRGSIGWNDGHVNFENTSFVRTRHGTKRNDSDNLFGYAEGHLDNAVMGHHHLAYGQGSASVVLPFDTAATATAYMIVPN